MFFRPATLLFVATTCAFSMGCAPTMAPRSVKFDEGQLKGYDQPGKNTIEGQAFLKTMGGDVKYGAGCNVRLIPVTDFTGEDFTRAVKFNERLQPPTPYEMQILMKYVRTAVGDGSGNFVFKDIPDGDYFVECVVQWAVPGGWAGLAATGGMAYGQVSVAGGETAKVIATRN